MKTSIGVARSKGITRSSARTAKVCISGTGGLGLRATAALDPRRGGLSLLPGASGRVGEPGEVPDLDAGPGNGSRTSSSPGCPPC